MTETRGERVTVQSRTVSTGWDWLFGHDRSAQARRMLVLVLLPALVFISTLTFDFVLDDTLIALPDAATNSSSHFALLSEPVRVDTLVLGFFRPAISLAYRIDNHLWNTNPAGYHFTNVIWHLIVTLLVYAVALRTINDRLTAWLAALLFAVLPVHTEAVVWVQGRVDLIPTAFLLIALLAMLNAQARPGFPAWRWAAIGALAYFCALLAKESATPFLLAWGMWECAALRPPITWRNRLPGACGRVSALVLSGMCYAGLRTSVIDPLSVHWKMNSLFVADRVAGFLAMAGEYSRRLAVPDASLTVFRGIPVPPPGGLVALGVLACVVFGCTIVYAWKEQRRLFPWIAWMAIMSVPAMGLVLLAYIPGTALLVADRYMYLPSVGWCIVMGACLAGCLRWTSAAQGSIWRPAIVAGLIIASATLTAISLSPWGDPIRFLEAARRQPDLSTWVQTVLNDNLGVLYLERGDLGRARQQFVTAARLSPSAASPRNNMGVLLFREGRPADAKPWLEEAIRLSPTAVSSYGNLGSTYEALGDLPAAHAAFRAGLRVAPASPWLMQGLARTAPRPAAPGQERLP